MNLPNTNEITQFLHCKKCLVEGCRPPDIGVGFTPIGLQIWCERHDINMMHIDFEGQQHPANLNSIDNSTLHDRYQIYYDCTDEDNPKSFDEWLNS